MRKTVNCEIKNEIALVTLNNPPVNFFNDELIEDLVETVKEVKTKDIRVLIITGAGKGFQAGADIKMFLKMKTEEDGVKLGEMCQNITDTVASVECPVIAMVNGMALGGGTELALSCDIRIASSKATFGLPEVGYGVFPGGGGTQRLARLIGIGRAKMLILSGSIIDASEAYNIGLVDQVVEPEQLLETTMKFAEKIAAQSPSAVKWAKRIMDESIHLSLKDGLSLERQYLGKLIAVGDQIEGANAFLEKRSPDFKLYKDKE